MDWTDKLDLMEQATMTRIADIYAAALQKALKNKSQFLRKMEDVRTGKIKPPAYYVQTGTEDKWREGFIRELIRQNTVIEDIVKELDDAGVKASELIRGDMVKVYETARQDCIDAVQQEARQSGIHASFAIYDKRQIAVLLQEEQNPFSKIAYHNLGQNPAIRRRLQNELAQATILGEGQDKVISRIRRVTGQSVVQARRVAQTERTRVASQARWQAGQEAADMGLRIYHIWRTRMVNSRDTHIALNGKAAMQGERFPGSPLHFPGDPEAPAHEVINCHCVLEPHVLRKGYTIDSKGAVRRDTA